MDCGKSYAQWVTVGQLSLFQRRHAGVRPGPTLSAIFFSVLLLEAKEDLPDGIFIRFRTNGSLSNLRRLLARTKTTEELITELLFTDNCAFLAHTEKAQQHIVSSSLMQPINSASPLARRRLRCCSKPLYDKPNNPPQISIDGTKLNAVEHFNYLSNVFSMPQSARILTSACPKPAVCFEDGHREYGRVTHSASTEIQVYRAVVVPTLLYGRDLVRLLEWFHQR